MPRLRTLSPVLFAAAALGFPAAAHADVEEDIINTTCSADQITQALQQASPVAWGFISGDPARLANTKAQLDAFLAQGPAGRKALLNKPQPDGSPSPIKAMAQYGPTAEQIFSTCDQF